MEGEVSVSLGRRSRIFRFEPMWVKEREYGEILGSTWEQGRGGGGTQINIFQSVKRC